MNLRAAALQKQLVTHHAELQAVLSSLRAEQMQLAVYPHGSPDQWTVQALLAHIASASEGLLKIAQAVTRGENPVPENWEGWWVWAAMIFFLGRQRSPLLDEVTQLDPARRMLATFTLGLFFLVITPIPLLAY